MDDSLSAVDAFVGKSILENCLLSGPLADKTRVLVTHALHVLDKTDYIYVMDNGTIVEQGTYNVSGLSCVKSPSASDLTVQDLMENSVVFSRLMEEHGNLEKEDNNDVQRVEALMSTVLREDKKDGPADVLMQAEERNIGAVTWSTYITYFRYAGGIIWVPIIIFCLVSYQGAQGEVC